MATVFCLMMISNKLNRPLHSHNHSTASILAMTDLSFYAAVLIGLAGSVHCVGMCGGIVSAMSFAIPAHKPFFLYALAYNSGRIASYCLAGALTGWLGQMVTQQNQAGLSLLQLISALFLLMLAAYIGGWWHGLKQIERAGQYLWRYLSPLAKTFIPFKTPLHALPYGMIWGWLPCGLVYSTLTWSLASGSVTTGAGIMLGFGLGTVPIMLLMALGFKHVAQIIRHPLSKQLIACCLLVYAIWLGASSLKLTF